MSKRENALSALFGLLHGVAGASVRRNEALPQVVPAGGLIILRNGDPGEPDVSLGPRTEFYTHRAEIEAFVTQLSGGGGEAALDALLGEIGTALAADRSLGGIVDHMVWSAPEHDVLAVEGSVPILAARIDVILEYMVSDPLAA